MNDKLNNKNLKTTYGLVIMTGAEKLLEFPERKEPLAFDWHDQNGVEYSLKKVFFKDKEVTLSCAIMASNSADFWVKYNAFFAEISKPNYQSLTIDDHGKIYQCFYKKSGAFKHSLKRLKNVSKVFVKFDLTLQIK